MSVTAVSLEAKKSTRGDNPLGVTGIDHVEFYVDDARSWANSHEHRLGMRKRAKADPSTGRAGRRAFVVGQGRINFLFAEAAGDDAEAREIAEHVEKHGNGVHDIAFRVKDVHKAIAHAVKEGCKVVREPTDYGNFVSGSILAFGDTTHTFLTRKDHALFAPGYVNEAGGIEEDEIQLMCIDHMVANVERMNEWCDWYARVFGFEEARHFDINTGRSALMSKVMGASEGYIKIPINEPSSKNSQIQEFLDEYRGAGIQHIALLTPNIITAIHEMRQRGMQFLEVPDTYYDAAPARVGEIRERMDDLKRLKILVDRDRADGYLLQLFSKPLFDRPTLFYEIIQRRGNSDGFGEGNFTALFEAIEREQQKRGTL
jgi:4-hydroxyphenylpyruvate dioxygenase